MQPKPPAPPDLPQELASLDDEPPTLRELELSERHVTARDWSQRDATGMRLTECRLDNVALDEATLVRAGFRDLVVNGGSWANANAADSSVRRAEFRNTRLTGVAFANATLDDVVFVDCRLDLGSFRFAKLCYVRFDGCLLAEADFYEAGVKAAAFSNCSLANASIAGVTFTDTELRGCDLTALGNAEQLRSVRMPWADVVQSADVLAAGLGIEIVE
jgi:uncharacterized protein YjbI with pentapeptide repeats